MQIETIESLKSAQAKTPPLTTRTVQRGKGRVNNFRAFSLACHVLRYLVRDQLTTVELSAASGAKYDSCQRIVCVAREAGLIKQTGFGESARGIKPMKYSIDFDQGLSPMGTMTIIDQALLRIRNGTQFTDAVRKGFAERFGLELEVDPGFVNVYTYRTKLGPLSPPQDMWIEGFTRAWALFPWALLDWQKQAVADRRERRDDAKKRGIYV
jgi:hypothetical protein